VVTELNTHGVLLGFGKHHDKPYTRVPVGYLKWMVNTPEMSEERRKLAEAELKRRGTHTPELDISGHAIDRASQQCLDISKDYTHGSLGRRRSP
jgi:hypothetical protein